jgi:hypothetical protein
LSVGRELRWHVDLSGTWANADHRQRGLGVELYTARRGLCPLKLERGSLTLAWCAGAEGGLIRVDSTDPGGAENQGAWVSLQASQELSWSLSNAWSLAADLAAVVPLTHYEFLAENPDEVLHEVPPVGWMLGLGAVVHLN